MKQGSRWTVLLVALCVLGTAGHLWAEDVIKVGACQPITGRFAFAGKHIHEGLMDSLNYLKSLLSLRRAFRSFRELSLNPS